jgi:hypothetical protein
MNANYMFINDKITKEEIISVQIENIKMSKRKITQNMTENCSDIKQSYVSLNADFQIM